MVDVYSIKCYTVTEKLLLGGDTLIKEFNDLTNFTSDKYLQINSCGFQSHGSSRITVLRSNGRKDYHFLYVINGECTAHTASGEKRLSEGDLLLYRPHEKQMYSFDSVCRTYWIHFTGYGVEELLNASNFDENIIHVGTDKTLIRIFDKIINDFVPNSDKERVDVDVIGYDNALAVANISSIADTQRDEDVVRDAQRQMTMLIYAQDAARKSGDFFFVIDDLNDYRSLSDFKSSAARELFKEWQSGVKEHESDIRLLDSRRDEYASATAAGKAKMRDTILELESKIESDARALKLKEYEVRRLEQEEMYGK